MRGSGVVAENGLYSAERLVRGASLVLAFVGVGLLAGWVLGSGFLRGGFGNHAAIHPHIGLLFIAAAISLWTSGMVSREAAAGRLGAVAAWFVILLGLLKLIAPLLGWAANVDLFLVRDQLATLGKAAPKPMTTGAAVYFMMLGTGLLLVGSRREVWRLVGRAIGLFTVLVGALMLITFLSNLNAEGNAGSATSSGIGTTIGILALGLGLSLGGVHARATHTDDARTHGVRRTVNLAVVVAALILTLTGGVSIWGAARAQRTERLRRESSERQARLTTILGSIHEAELADRAYRSTGREEFHVSLRSVTDSIVRLAGRVDSLPFERERPEGRAALAALVRTRLVAETALGARLASRATGDSSLSFNANLIATVLAVCFLIAAGMTINRDLRKRALAEGERDRFFDLSLDMLCIAGADGYFKRLSPAFTRTLGWSVEEMLARPFLDFVHPDDRAATLLEAERQTIAGEPVLAFENRYQHRNGDWRVLSWRSVPEPGGFMYATARDVTDLKAADMALRSAKESAEAANRAKSDFLARMSHELRTPLNSIIGFSEILEDGGVGPLNEKQHRYVANVLLSGRNLLQLINSILDLSKVEAGRMELSLAEFDVASTLEEARGIVSTLAEKRGLTVHLVLTETLPRLRADEGKFRQVMYNLLGNAIKFTESGGEVTLSARVIRAPGTGDAGKWLEVTVADTGIGIAPDDLGRIFNEFEQLNVDPSREQEGTGLGLALAKKLVELHGGTMHVESEPGRGSVFRFILPYAVAEVAAEFSGDTAQPEGVDPSNPLILVVENEPSARDLIVHYLSDAGYRTATAETGAEAIRLSRLLKPQAITLDILLPDRDGLLILAQLKSSPETRKIPVVVVSVTDRRELGFGLGAVEWLVKPIDKQALIGALEGTIPRRPLSSVPKILVVDDEPSMLEYLNEVLRERGFEVISSLGGRAAIDLALARRPDLILLDLMMPDMNGFDVVRVLRERRQTADIPILILTGMDLTQADLDRLGSSVQAVVAKGGAERLLTELARFCAVPTPRLPRRAGDAA